MCDDIHEGLIHDPTVSRRTFGLLAAGVAGGLATRAYAADVVEKDVSVKTADGAADAALFYPAGQGTWPGVLLWPDFLSLRPVFREMGRRLASAGYVVLVPNFYYRSKKAPVFEGSFDFSSAEDRGKIAPMREALTTERVEADAAAYVDFIDAQPQTNKKARIGTQGYCMGGPLAVRTAGVRPGRTGAVATFHSGPLVTDDPKSPHLIIPKTKSSYMIATAENDDKQRPQEKDQLREIFEKAKLSATVEVYPANHGWCVPGSPVYKEEAAERAWTELLRLYQASLA